MELWHEQRRRIKQGLSAKKEPSSSKEKQTSKPNLQKSLYNLKEQSIPFKKHEKKFPKVVDLSPLVISDVKEEKDSGVRIETEQISNQEEKEFILVNTHISPTETVADFVFIPSLEYDRFLEEREAVDKIISDKSLNDDIEIEDKLKDVKDNLMTSKIFDKPEETIKVKPVEQHEKQVKELGKQQTSSQKPDPIKAKQTSQGKETKSKVSKKELEQQKILSEKLKAKKIRIQKRLENVKRERETRTVGGRSCIAAPNTPVIFDMVCAKSIQYFLYSYIHYVVSINTC